MGPVDLYHKLVKLFPDMLDQIVQYQEVNTNHNHQIKLYLKSGQKCLFTYISSEEWKLETWPVKSTS